MDTAQANARISDAAHWQMRWDGGLAWLCSGPRLAPRMISAAGGLLLRRWLHSQFPKPAQAPVVGIALAGATQVNATAETPVVNAIHWYEVSRVNAAGLSDAGDGSRAMPVAYDKDGLDVGALPNPPLHVAVVPYAGGWSLLTWYYNELGQQVAPDHFALHHDSGTGVISDTPFATVAYVAGQAYYQNRWIGPAWAGYRIAVAAVSAAGVRSLLALEDDRGLSPSYGFEGRVGAVVCETGAVPAAPGLRPI